jgi:hypothetical protein
MNANILLPLLTGALSVLFAAALLRRFAVRRGPHLLVWALGLTWYAISAATEAIGGAFGWSVPLYRGWYLTGAVGVAAYLGAGTVYLHPGRAFGVLTVACIAIASLPALLSGQTGIAVATLLVALVCAIVLARAPARFADAVFVALLVASVLAAIRIWSAAVDPSLLPAQTDEVVTGQALAADARSLTPSFNIAGASLLVLGALVSAHAYWRTRRGWRRVVSNGLIALGAFVPSLTSGLTRFGFTSAFFTGQLIGVVCLLAGFVLSAPPARRSVP